jgi:hypothetical protein
MIPVNYIDTICYYSADFQKSPFPIKPALTITAARTAVRPKQEKRNKCIKKDR